jgi:hypothetical protein
MVVVKIGNNFFIFFYLHLPSAAFSSLHLPLLVKVPKGGFGGIFDRPALPCRLGPPHSASGRDFASKWQGSREVGTACRLALGEEATS